MRGRRSRRWFAPDDLRAFGHRSRAKQMGWEEEDFRRPVVAIVSTWSDLNTCHTHLPERVGDIKRGILRAGGGGGGAAGVVVGGAADEAVGDDVP